MNAKELLCRAMREKPETRRASRAKGKPIDFTKVLGMGLNENVFGMSPKAEEAIIESSKLSYRYGDFQTYEAKKALAEEYGLEMTNIVTGAGSSAIINLLGSVFLEEGDELITCMPTFAAFLDIAYENLATPVIVDLDETQTFDLDGILAKINDKTKMIVICNPNNPTGTYVGEEKLRAFIEKVPDNIVIVMDEAYIEFATAEDCVSAVGIMKEMKDKPIIVLRTFSKFYGLAGIRAGYALAQEELVAEMTKAGFVNMSKPAQAGMIEALKDKEHGAYVKEMVAKTREYLMEEIAKTGCTVYPSQTNFVYFDTHKNSPEVLAKLLEKGVHTGGGHPCNRVTVSTMPDCEEFIKCLKEVMAE